MKTAISLSDDLFKAADAHAKERGLSRSELYALALEEYLARRDPDEITARLNAVYEDEANQPDAAWLAASAEVLRRVEW